MREEEGMNRFMTDFTAHLHIYPNPHTCTCIPSITNCSSLIQELVCLVKSFLSQTSFFSSRRFTYNTPSILQVLHLGSFRANPCPCVCLLPSFFTFPFSLNSCTISHPPSGATRRGQWPVSYFDWYLARNTHRLSFLYFSFSVLFDFPP